MRNNDKQSGKKVKKRKKKIENKKFSWKLLVKFLAFEIVFTIITAPFVLLYGPFDEAKKIYVGSAMGSMNNQWLATMFLSQEKINEIIGSNDGSNHIEEQDNSLVSIPKSKDDTIEQYTLEDNSKFTGHVLVINDPTRVHVGISSKLGTEGETVTQIAENYDAVAAINGGSFTDNADSQQWTSNGGIPSGLLISNGEVLHDDLAGASTNMAAITRSGMLLVGQYTLDQLKEKDVTEALSFGPTLVVNGKAASLKGVSDGGMAPRTLIGQRKHGEIVLVVLDSKLPGGRIAATYEEAQEVMLQLGCITATNLDGGKSTTMYYDGEVINNPSFALGERPIASGFIVK